MWGSISQALKKILCCCLIIIIGGCATTGNGDPRDPFEGFNRGVYSFNEAMDNALFSPISRAYKTIVPDIIDRGVTNFFNNLDDIAVVANDLMQLKIDQALSDATRFIFNSTIGLLGFFDISSYISLPKHDEDFGQTLAHYGVGSGPFLMAPFFGPTTLRDATGFLVDRSLLSPIFYLDDAELQAGLLTLNYIDVKADLLSAKKILGEAALDEYEFIKNAYFEKRANQINDGAMPEFIE
jgi:phospholipid-binding lipoprotein MlaA